MYVSVYTHIPAHPPTHTYYTSQQSNAYFVLFYNYLRPRVQRELVGPMINVRAN